MADLKQRLEAASRLVKPEPDAFERFVARRDGVRRRRRLGSAAVALVLAAGAVGGAVYAFGGPDRTSPLLGNPPGQGLVAATGEYYYTKTLVYSRDDACDDCPGGMLGPWTFERWFGPDASGREVFVDSPGPEGSVDYGGPGPTDRAYGPGGMPYQDLSDLPTEPAELAARLRGRSSRGGASPNPIAASSPGRTEEDTSLLRALQDLFAGGEQFTPPLVRAAMYEVARTITGVRFVPQTVDPLGRPALSLRWIVQYEDDPEGPPSEVEWFFDPETTQLMAETWTEDGLVLEARVVVVAGIAGSTEGPPRPDDLFFPEGEGTPSFLA